MPGKKSKWNEELDIRGEICPYTFAKTRLIIEEMKRGKVLRIVLDYLPATHNVPKNLQYLGHTVLAVEKISDTDWEIIVKKTGR
jgi:tRNA 2-thiouridine synthesizing protein A